MVVTSTPLPMGDVGIASKGTGIAGGMAKIPDPLLGDVEGLDGAVDGLDGAGVPEAEPDGLGDRDEDVRVPVLDGVVVAALS